MKKKDLNTHENKKENNILDEFGKVKDAITNATVDKSKKLIIDAIDENGDGEIDIEDIITKGMKLPGIWVNREDFLQKELLRKYPQEVIDIAIKNTPAYAKIEQQEIDKIADEVIKYERICVSGISAALSAPGGVASVATIPVDIVQYYGYLLRVMQKLMYLYGFPEISRAKDGVQFDAETMNILIICMGVMYGVAEANIALKTIASALAKGVEKKLLRAALTKGTIYPIVKKVSSWFGKAMTKQVFAGFFKKSIPIIGGVLGGGITFVSFKLCCDKLKSTLQNTVLTNPDNDVFDTEEVLIIE